MWFAPPKYRIVRRRVTLKGKRREYVLHKERARSHATQRAHHYCGVYEVSFNKIYIKNLKTRWGSCSKNKNLNFHYKIALLPPHLADYLVVHEVCHLKEFNHSKKFWDMVGQQVPNYHTLRRELHKTF